MIDDLCAEAIRLARILLQLIPDEPEVRGVPGVREPAAFSGATR